MDKVTRTYWDRVCIADGYFDVDWFTELFDLMQSTKEQEVGDVTGSPKEDTDFYARIGEWDEYKEWFDYLLGLNLIPVLPDHNIYWVFRSHTFPIGGKMAEHHDGNHSVAVSIYLSDCEGGELCARNEERLLIQPKRGRMVIMKGGTLHSVLPVKSGKRDSLQLFIGYETKEQ